MDIKEFYELSQDIPKELEYHNKYTWLGYHNILEIRYMDINTIIKKRTPKDDFISRHGRVLLIPNIINGVIVDISLRAMDSKALNTIIKVPDMPYNIGNLHNFKYGDPLILVEGPADVAGLKLIDPNMHVVALKTNGISKGYYKLFKSITDRIVLLLDSDIAAGNQLNRIRKELRRLSIDLTIINQFSGLNDTGDIVELIMDYKRTGSQDKLQELKSINTYYKAQIETVKNSF